MSDLFYSLVRTVCHPPFIFSRNPTLVGVEKIDRQGAFLLCANHTSAYDIALLMAHSTKRRLDFVSAIEICTHPVIGPLYRATNAFPLDRSKPDGGAVRELMHRLERGRVVALFPEGGFRHGDQSVVHGGKIRPGLGRIAILAQVPVIPVVILNSVAYGKPSAWAWLRHTRYGMIFGDPMTPPKLAADAPPADIKAAAATFEAEYCARMQALYARIKAAAPDIGGVGVEP